MNRTNLIQSIIDKINADSYLELGVADGSNFEKVKCNNKIGVDPNISSKATYLSTSDNFFLQNTSKFDVIFIDGLHHSDQVLRDVINSLDVLKEGGYIVCHDMSPLKEEHQVTPFAGGVWNGDCWKAFVELRKSRSDLFMTVVDIDHGCAVIKRGEQVLLKSSDELSFQNLEKNRKEWLNLISWEEFLGKHIGYSLDDLIKEYVLDTDNPENNYRLGLYYDSIGQTASALSFFLRCAERSTSPEDKYECLLRASSCFEKQGKRNFTVRGLLQHAISILPKRPEAYYLLSRFYQTENREGSWQDSYMIASIGEKVAEFNSKPLRNEVDYPGSYGITFQKGVAAWWCGLCQESRDIFLDLLHKQKKMEPQFIQPCLNNLKLMKTAPFLNYAKKDHDRLNFKFSNSETIEENFSEAFQDMFVLTMLNGKTGGTYLEIGSGDPFYGNNTLLLEKVFNWRGVALDLDENFVNDYNISRKSKCVRQDARLINYKELLSGFGLPKKIDYLQLDCDPPDVTYQILLTLPFDTYKFAVITYEHDYYCDGTRSYQDKSVKYLESHGYLRVVNNISPDNHRNYEDWWVHPDLVDRSQYEKFFDISSNTKNGRKIFLGE